MGNVPIYINYKYLFVWYFNLNQILICMLFLKKISCYWCVLTFVLNKIKNFNKIYLEHFKHIYAFSRFLGDQVLGPSDNW